MRHKYEEYEREIELRKDPFIEEKRQERRMKKYDSCCRSNFDCDLRKKAELNITHTSNLRHCDCETEFVECIKTLRDDDDDDKYGDEYLHYYSIYTRKCYAEDYPIEKCIKYQYFYKHKKVFDQIPVIGLKGTVRCLEYKMDKSKTKSIQNFDIPFYFRNGHSDYYSEWERVFSESGSNDNIHLFNQQKSI